MKKSLTNLLVIILLCTTGLFSGCSKPYALRADESPQEEAQEPTISGSCFPSFSLLKSLGKRFCHEGQQQADKDQRGEADEEQQTAPAKSTAKKSKNQKTKPTEQAKKKEPAKDQLPQRTRGMNDLDYAKVLVDGIVPKDKEAENKGEAKKAEEVLLDVFSL